MRTTQTPMPRACAACLSALLAALPLGAQPREGADVYTLPAMEVEGLRQTLKTTEALPQAVSILAPEALEEQFSISLDHIRALSIEVPGFSPSREKMTGRGETFRGREPLFLVDGIPQSSPLRNGSRDGYTIDPVALERIEVVRGASAAQGMGATGGLIQYVTISPPAEEGWRARTDVQVRSSTTFDEDGFDYRGAVASGVTSGRWGAVLAGAYTWRGMSYDGDGNLVALDNTQGDTQNSATRNGFAKVQYQIAAEQELTVSANLFDMEQELEYRAVNGVQAQRRPGTSVKGGTAGEPAHNRAENLSLQYVGREIAGGAVTVDLFYYDLESTFGGGNFNDFRFFRGQSPVPFDQSRNSANKKGAKAAYARTFDVGKGLGLVSGVDYLREDAEQVLIWSGRSWVPPMEFTGYAPYVQLDQGLGRFRLTGGLRYEVAELEVPDYRVLAFYSADADVDPTLGLGHTVTGGSPSYEEVMWNVGVVYEVRDNVELYAARTQGFSLPDVGRILRDGGLMKKGSRVSDALPLQPIITENWEGGVRVSGGKWRGDIAVFHTHSEEGERLVDTDGDGSFNVLREEIATYGVELTAEYAPWEATTLGFAGSWLEGEVDTNQDGRYDSRLTAANIGPAKVAGWWRQEWTADLSTRLQGQYFFDREYPTADETRDFQGYAVFDVLGEYWVTEAWQVYLGVENVLDEQFVTYFSQMDGANSSYFAGRGRTITLGARGSF